MLFGSTDHPVLCARPLPLARSAAKLSCCCASPRCRCRRSTQVLTWAVIPVLQGYAISGAFTILGRLRSSLKRLWVFYLIIGALAAVGVLGALAAHKLELATLPALVFTLSNTYGGYRVPAGRQGRGTVHAVGTALFCFAVRRAGQHPARLALC